MATDVVLETTMVGFLEEIYAVSDNE
jgi:peptidyl-prolyl cis-trans isomerase-like 1